MGYPFNLSLAFVSALEFSIFFFFSRDILFHFAYEFCFIFALLSVCRGSSSRTLCIGEKVEQERFVTVTRADAKTNLIKLINIICDTLGLAVMTYTLRVLADRCYVKQRNYPPLA